MYKRISLVSLMLSALVLFPYTAAATLNQYEIQFNETFRFTTQYELSYVLPGSPYYIGTTVTEGPTSQTTSGRFFLDSDFGNATSLSNITTSNINPSSYHFLCGVGNCFVDLAAASLFLGDNPHIVGLAYNVPCCILEEISFDGWFTRATYNWDDPHMPAIPFDFRYGVGPGEYVHRSADAGFRGLEFGTYSIRQVPEPSTLILFGLGLAALAARLSWVRRLR